MFLLCPISVHDQSYVHCLGLFVQHPVSACVFLPTCSHARKYNPCKVLTYMFYTNVQYHALMHVYIYNTCVCVCVCVYLFMCICLCMCFPLLCKIYVHTCICVCALGCALSEKVIMGIKLSLNLIVFTSFNSGGKGLFTSSTFTFFKHKQH